VTLKKVRIEAGIEYFEVDNSITSSWGLVDD